MVITIWSAAINPTTANHQQQKDVLSQCKKEEEEKISQNIYEHYFIYMKTWILL